MARLLFEQFVVQLAVETLVIRRCRNHSQSVRGGYDRNTGTPSAGQLAQVTEWPGKSFKRSLLEFVERANDFLFVCKDRGVVGFSFLDS